MPTTPVQIPGTATIPGTNILYSTSWSSVVSGIVNEYIGESIQAIQDETGTATGYTINTVPQSTIYAATAQALGPNANPSDVSAAQQAAWASYQGQLNALDPSQSGFVTAASIQSALPSLPDLLNNPNNPNEPSLNLVIWLGVGALGLIAVSDLVK